MERYRVRLKNGRVIGPFLVAQFGELFLKGHISGDEDCQVFPVGDWFPLKQFSEINEEIKRAKEDTQKTEVEATFIKKISEINLNNSDKENEQNVEVNIPEFPKEFSFDKQALSISEEDIKNVKINETSVEENDINSNKTTIVKKDEIINTDSTVINKDTLKYLEKLKEENRLKILEEQSTSEPEIKIDLENDSTQLISIDSIKESLKLEIKKNDQELVEKEKIELQKIKEANKITKEEKKIKSNLVKSDDEDLEASKKKKLLITVIAIFIMFIMFFPNDKKKIVKQITPIYPDIIFPTQYEEIDEVKAKEEYLSALKLLKTNTYNDKLQALKKLKSSVEFKFENNPAMSKLILNYADLLPENQFFSQSANKIFKLIQINMSKLYSDPELNAAAANFYLNIGKEKAAISIIEKFNILKKNKPSAEQFSIYLIALMKVGNLVKSKALYEKLSSINSNSFRVITSLILYNLKNSNLDKASELIQKIENEYTDNVKILLFKAKLFTYLEDFESLNIVLNKIKDKEAENSPFYYAKYLEYRGLYMASNKNFKAAIKDFKESLRLNESSELRSRLASLSIGDDESTNLLINESKALQEIEIAKNHVKNNNWNFAFASALEATRIAPKFITAKLFLANLQAQQSYFEESITSLESLFNDYPNSKEVAFALIDTLVRAYKFADARKYLTILSTTPMQQDPTYLKLTAKYYLYKDEYSSAVMWLRKAINNNPTDDSLIFELAKLFIRYNRFDKAKLLINRSIDLDPSQVDYRISYANIIYEVDGADAAVGYLYDILKDFPDNAKVYSSIGIFYYKSGQLKYFDKIKEKISGLPKVDETLYDFLVKAATIDDKPNQIIEYSKKLISIAPSNLEAKMNLGKFYMANDKPVEALNIFREVQKRVETYPKLQSYMSKLYLIIDKTEDALKLAKKEVKDNPTSIDGYILLGDIYYKQKDYIQSEKEFKKAQRIDSKNIEVLLGLAKINLKKNQYEIALDLFNKAKLIDSNNAEIYKLIGDVYRKIGQSTLAAESYKTFLELSPNTKYREQLNNYIKMME